MSVPPWLNALVECGVDDQSLREAVSSVVHELGFDTMMYGAARGRGRGGESDRYYFWTTAPRDWVIEYDQNSYVEIDPRVSLAWDAPPPLIWDRSFAEGNGRVAHFLDRAATYGIGSGLSLYINEEDYTILIALSRRQRTLTVSDRRAMHRRVGDALHFGYVFHWMYMRRVIADDSRPRQSGLPLSHRERDCIKYAAHGMTSADIGHKLGITERTVNFHFSNAITKLGVLNRHEAIASAVAQRLIRFESMGDAKRSAYFASRRPQKHRRRR